MAAPNVVDGGESNKPCLACDSKAGNAWAFVEDVQRTSKEGHFRYNCCAACGSLELYDPAQANELYNSQYYSFTDTRGSRLERVATKARNRYELSGSGILGKALARMWPGTRHASLRPLLSGKFSGGFSRSSSILDVGCGAGDWLRELRNERFSSLAGCDPFLEGDTDSQGITLRKGGPDRFHRKFDIITAHHSFEHSPNGSELLEQMSHRLNPKGIIIIRIPVAASYGWKRYGGHWVQLDPPFHARLYSIVGMTEVAKKAGFELADVIHDSTHFMVTGSEAQIAGLRSHTNMLANKRLPQKVFNRRRANRIAAFCNLLGSGDQAAFYLRRKA